MKTSDDNFNREALEHSECVVCEFRRRLLKRAEQLADAEAGTVHYTVTLAHVVRAAKEISSQEFDI